MKRDKSKATVPFICKCFWLYGLLDVACLTFKGFFLFSATIFASDHSKIFVISARCYPWPLHPVGFLYIQKLNKKRQSALFKSLNTHSFIFILPEIQALQFQSRGQTSDPALWGSIIDPLHLARSGQPAKAFTWRGGRTGCKQRQQRAHQHHHHHHHHFLYVKCCVL